MSETRRINNDTSVTVVGRTAPIPPGQQPAGKSLPVVLAIDQPTIPVAEQNRVQSEVALSMLGIPRSEVALGIFADVNTYDVNPTEWSAFPIQKSSHIFGAEALTYEYKAAISDVEVGWGLTHLAEESGALVEAPPNKSTILTSKRFFRYQPGRVSAATFGVKTSFVPAYADDRFVRNPAIRKYGIFDNTDGYYWETKNQGIGDEYSVVRRTASLIKRPLRPFGNVTGTQQEDYGICGTRDTAGFYKSSQAYITGGKISINQTTVNLLGVKENMVPYIINLSSANVNFSASTVVTQVVQNGADVDITINTTFPHTAGNYDVSFAYAGDLVVVRDGLVMTHAAMYDNSLLKAQVNTPIISCNKSLSTFTLSGTSGLKLGQLVRYDTISTGATPSIINNSDYDVYKIEFIKSDGGNDIVTLRPLLTGGSIVVPKSTQQSLTSHYLVTPVPFIFPTQADDSFDIAFPFNRKFKTNLEITDNNNPTTGVGIIDTDLTNSTITTFKSQVDSVNNGIKCLDYNNSSSTANGTVDGYRRWILDNVKPEFYGVYEYKVPRSRFSTDFVDGVAAEATNARTVVYSDVVQSGGGGTVTKYPGQAVVNSANADLTRSSVWNTDFGKVSMNKIEFSWYGAVGAIFLAYVPVGNSEARWVRVHHLRASNQLKVASLGNATLPITYNVYGGGTQRCYGIADNSRGEYGYSYTGGKTSSEFITKYGASYYIDGGDRGTVRLHNNSQDTPTTITSSVTACTVDRRYTEDTGSNGPYLVVNDLSDMYMYSTLSGADIPSNAVKVTFIEPLTGSTLKRVYLNKAITVGLSADTISFNATTPQVLFGISSKTNITTSTGEKVRNRIQVYPTKLSTGVANINGSIVTLKLIKNALFQTLDYNVHGWANKSIIINTAVAAVSSVRQLKPAGLSTVIPAIALSATSGSISNDSTVYGWFRVYRDTYSAINVSTVFGSLKYTATNTTYEFTPKDSITGNVFFVPESYFVPARSYKNDGTLITSNNLIGTPEDSVDRLSSILIDNSSRRPIPNTGSEISNFFLENGSEIYDLAPYFDYNKEYISFPLTNISESLHLAVKASGSEQPVVAGSLTWEEQ